MQRLFALDAANTWQQLPVQFDPIDAEGHLAFFTDDSFRQRPIERSDLITLATEEFGWRKTAQSPPMPCIGGAVYEMQDVQLQRYAYLTTCDPRLPPARAPAAVRFTPAEHVLESDAYRYRFNPANYMLFDEIDFRSPKQPWEPVALASEMLIHADVRNFFSMDFDSHEIESHLEESRLGPLGDLARLSFFLRILFFKIKMSLSTDVGFYSTSGHIPMMVSIPVNAYNYLNPGSGILYHWQLSDLAKNAQISVQMPRLDPALSHRSFTELGKVGLAYCHGEECLYHFVATIGDKRLAMDLGIHRALVERGFFPQYVEDVAANREAMAWDLKGKSADRRFGMYFEVSGLPEGGHPWDFWLRLGGPEKNVFEDCPRPLRIARLSQR